MIRNILLDLDDTLLDFHEEEAAALRLTLESLDIDPTTELMNRYSAINDACWKRLERGEMTRAEVQLERFRQLFREFSIPASGEAARDRYGEALSSMGRYFIDDAVRLLETLSPRYRLYLASNGTARVQHGRIANAGLGKYFLELFISEEMGHNKPSAEFFEFCFRRIPDCVREETLIVGDSLTSDILGGNNAGILTCWFNPRGKENTLGVHVDYEITRLMELPALLGSRRDG